MLTDTQRSALKFWRSAYSAGVRITCDDNAFQYSAALNYWQRLMRFGSFGIFPETLTVPPPTWVAAGVTEHEAELRRLLCQPFPTAYQRFAAHVLVLDYEVRPIEAHAKARGFDISSIGMNGGQFLMCYGECKPITTTQSPPPIPPILEKFRRIEIEKANS
jgi:hypothetical protein